jgi:hypothetical protein
LQGEVVAVRIPIERSIVDLVMERGYTTNKNEAAVTEIEIDSLYDELQLNQEEYERLM